MGCGICGRGSCIASFHSVEDQQEFDDIADRVKERSKSRIYDAVNNLSDGVWIIDDQGVERYLVELDSILKIIDEVDL